MSDPAGEVTEGGGAPQARRDEPPDAKRAVRWHSLWFRRAVDRRTSQHRADVATLAALVALVGAAALMQRLLSPVPGSGGTLVLGAAMALVPALLWLAFFHHHDRREPEPADRVVETAVLGALVAAALGMPVLDRWVQVDSWLYASPMVHLAGAVLVVGCVEETLKYAALRFSVYASSEFDELADGMVYGSAVGLGYATAQNLALVLQAGVGDLALLAARFALTSLAHAAFTCVTGYFLAHQKLRQRPIWWMATGVGTAATLNGTFDVLRAALLRGAASTAGGGARPWASLGLAALLVVCVTLTLSWAIDRSVGTVRTGPRTEPPA